MSADPPSPARGRIGLFGWRAWYRRPERRRLLQVLQDTALGAPDHMDLGEHGPEPFDRAWFEGPGVGPAPMIVGLSRQAGPAWLGYVSVSDRAWLRLQIEAEALSAIGPAAWFAAADALAQALQPDFAGVDLEPPPSPLPGGEDYYRGAPIGLAARTWFGPRLARQLDLPARLAGVAPCVATPAAEGGVRLDLAPEPWAASTEQLAEGREAAMAALTAAGLLGADFDRGGFARESALGCRLDIDARTNGVPDGEPGPDPAPLLAAAASGEALEDVVLSWLELPDAQLAGLTADGLALDWAELPRADFSRARLTNAGFVSAVLEGARFAGAHLDNCDLGHAIASETTWRDARLETVRFDHAVLSRADFEGAQAQDAAFPEASLQGARFAGARLLRADFTGADCRDASFAGADLREADFTGADVTGADFTDAKRTDVRGLDAS